jgi:hypothetical protein
MAKRKATSQIPPAIGELPAQTKARSRMRIDASKPRNPIALNPLLGKSTPHQDKRKRSRLTQAKLAIRDATKDNE